MGLIGVHVDVHTCHGMISGFKSTSFLHTAGGVCPVSRAYRLAYDATSVWVGEGEDLIDAFYINCQGTEPC